MESIPILRVEFEGRRLAFDELGRQVPFEQGLKEQGDEKHKHFRFDSLNFLEQ